MGPQNSKTEIRNSKQARNSNFWLRISEFGEVHGVTDKKHLESSTIWSASAERSGDGAFADSVRLLFQSGVALRLPPHSIRFITNALGDSDKMPSSRMGVRAKIRQNTHE
jgi:hypothetical protein